MIENLLNAQIQTQKMMNEHNKALNKIKLEFVIYDFKFMNYYYTQHYMAISYNVILPLLFLLVSQSAVIEGQNIKGCAKYFTNSYDEVRCIRCYFGMGLTDKNTCEFCKTGERVVGLVCQKIDNNPIVQPAKNQTATNATKQITLNPSNASIKVDNISSNVSNSFVASGQPSMVLSKTNFDFYSLGNTSDASKQVKLDQKISNCLKFNTDMSKCLVCQPIYSLQISGKCILKNQQSNSINITQLQTTKNNNNVSKSTNSLQTKAVGGGILTVSDRSQVTIQSINNLQNQNNSTKTNQNQATGNANLTIKASAKTETPQVNSNNQDVGSNNTTIKSIASGSLNEPQQKPVVHKFPNYPFCFDFDSGKCWACVPGYLLNRIIDKCVPYVKPPQPILPSDSQNSEQKQADSTPQVSPSDNCNLFNNETGICEQCFRNYYLNQNSKLCVAVDKLCRTYDPDTGQCLSCYVKYKLQQGKCVLV